ncbi:hypothetical protein V1264_016914 [Littorina saxatilis]|uniref:Integrase core domain-containing protein n=1 Tax=Littorina saxatilis TaxID=31220 RepID=A0AAN9BIF2_9CAEN
MVRLRQMELHCSREMVRDACRRVDPEGVALRALLRHNIVRRTYRVEHPNALWHVDGNHKLIRWSIVIHGGIDGFSRTVFFWLRLTTTRRQQFWNNLKLLRAILAFQLD